MTNLSIDKLASFIVQQSLKVMAGLFIILSCTQVAGAIPYSITFSGVIDTSTAPSAAPVLGIGDPYSGQLSFDIDSSDVISNVSGNAVLNGFTTQFTGFSHRTSGNSNLGAFIFSINPVGGSFKISSIKFDLSASGISSNPDGSLFDFVSANDVSVSTVNLVTLSPIGASFAYNHSFDDFVLTTVPLPAGLPLYAAGLGILGFIGWRRKQKNA